MNRLAGSTTEAPLVFFARFVFRLLSIMISKLCSFLALCALVSCNHETFDHFHHHHHHQNHHHQPSLQLKNLARLEEAGIPTPYRFQYNVDAGDGSHSREESSDDNGRVSGSYSIRLADGRFRTVKYTADEHGYHANVLTNEMGTESQDPANVHFESSAPTAKEVTLEENDKHSSEHYKALSGKLITAL